MFVQLSQMFMNEPVYISEMDRNNNSKFTSESFIVRIIFYFAVILSFFSLQNVLDVAGK